MFKRGPPGALTLHFHSRFREDTTMDMNQFDTAERKLHLRLEEHVDGHELAVLMITAWPEDEPRDAALRRVSV